VVGRVSCKYSVGRGSGVVLVTIGPCVYLSDFLCVLLLLNFYVYIVRTIIRGTPKTPKSQLVTPSA
jgi:hypothetical protein